jgi:hypothetical protein
VVRACVRSLYDRFRPPSHLNVGTPAGATQAEPTSTDARHRTNAARNPPNARRGGKGARPQTNKQEKGPAAASPPRNLIVVNTTPRLSTLRHRVVQFCLTKRLPLVSRQVLHIRRNEIHSSRSTHRQPAPQPPIQCRPFFVFSLSSLSPTVPFRTRKKKTRRNVCVCVCVCVYAPMCLLSDSANEGPEKNRGMCAPVSPKRTATKKNIARWCAHKSADTEEFLRT